ncbi:hypothetical protein [Hymenobacter sp. APR13]|uniref:hypothetical protein n=1 Tax=Hymenobacter sp. APR13 TaxID=1356852 RepID=UPI000A6B7A37|nr:hypothetical protein [Hymenobacter sp. APR13]
MISNARLFCGVLALPLLAASVAGCEPAPPRGNSHAAQTRPQPRNLRLDSLRADSISRTDGRLPGAILPSQRIVAFYGNPLHKGMGILGALPKDQMLLRLQQQAAEWQQADSIPVRPALHMTAIIAQRDSGADGMYRLSLPDSTIRRVIRWGQEHKALVFLDVQVGLSTLPQELPQLEKYLRLPFVHLGIDPEFSMKSGRRPGTEVGEFDARDINYARQFLARVVSQHQLPPKVLVVHRFRQDMVTNYQQIRLDPRVQIVMHMDGWGTPSVKRSSYRKFIRREPVEYAGFKIFYRNDSRTNSRLMTPQEVAGLTPTPLYIQYQ